MAQRHHHRPDDLLHGTTSVLERAAGSPRLSPSESVELWEAVAAGRQAQRDLEISHLAADRDFGPALERVVLEGWEAEHRLVEGHLWLVADLARRAAARTGVSATVLVAEGLHGLLRAIDRHDPGAAPASFAEAAGWWVRRALADAVGPR